MSKRKPHNKDAGYIAEKPAWWSDLELCTDREAQEILQKSAVTLWRERKEKRLPYRRVGGTIMYTRDDLKSYIDNCKA